MKLPRALLLIAGAAAVVALPRVIGGIQDRFGGLDFEPYGPVPAFRHLAAGETSTPAFDPLVGLGGGQNEEPPASAPDLDPLCDALFFAAEEAEDEVPVAYFSDYNCPYCRVLSERLAELEAEGEIAISLHELPLLGETSRTAARAALSAGLQDAHLQMHEALMSTRFAPTPGYLGRLAERIGLSRSKLIDGMDSDRVTDTLKRSRALASRFGFIGTPDLVVGSTVVVGQIGETRLRRLVDRERRDGPLSACRAAER